MTNTRVSTIFNDRAGSVWSGCGLLVFHRGLAHLFLIHRAKGTTGLVRKGEAGAATVVEAR
jgi:hypothetical protein